MKANQIFSHRRPTKITLIQDDPPFTEEELITRRAALTRSAKVRLGVVEEPAVLEGQVSVSEVNDRDQAQVSGIGRSF